MICLILLFQNPIYCRSNMSCRLVIANEKEQRKRITNSELKRKMWWKTIIHHKFKFVSYVGNQCWQSKLLMTLVVPVGIWILKMCWLGGTPHRENNTSCTDSNTYAPDVSVHSSCRNVTWGDDNAFAFPYLELDMQVNILTIDRFYWLQYTNYESLPTKQLHSTSYKTHFKYILSKRKIYSIQ